MNIQKGGGQKNYVTDSHSFGIRCLSVASTVNTVVLLSQEGQDWRTLTAGTNCNQEMVNMNLLRYVNTGAKTQDFFVFYLSDGDNQSPRQHFHISVKDLEKGTGIHCIPFMSHICGPLDATVLSCPVCDGKMCPHPMLSLFKLK